MEIEEIENKIQELSKKLEKLKKIKKDFRLNCGDIYYYIESYGEVDYNYDRYTVTDDAYYNLGNYFKSEEEANLKSKKINIYTQLKRLALRLNKGEKIDWDNNNEKYYIYYENNKLNYDYSYYWKDICQIYCLDENFLDIAIEEIGEDNLKLLFEGE